VEQGFGPELIKKLFEFDLFGKTIVVNLTQTVTTTWFLMAVIILFAWLGARNLNRIPKGVQCAVEGLVEAVNNLTRQTMGENRMGFAPYVGTLLIFIALANIAGLFGLRPPTADLNTTFALALITFCMVHFFGAKYKGTGTYLKGFLEPMPFLLPLNIIGEIATPVSLSFRLFGNIVGGLIIMSLLYQALASASVAVFGAIPFLESVPFFQFFIPIALHGYFDLFAGVLQSFIFTMLTMVFVSIAAD